MKYHYQSLKIQKKLGKKVETAEGLVFLAEDLEISGNYDKSIEAFIEASEIFRELGKLRNVKDITKEKTEVLYFAGCRYSFDRDLRKIARNAISLSGSNILTYQHQGRVFGLSMTWRVC